MPHFINKSTAIWFLVILCFSLSSLEADTVHLKDGSQLNGEIIGEGPNGVTIEYFATATIKDQRTISQADIERVEKATPDQKDFEELGSLDTPATVMDTSFYDPLVDRKIPEFIAKHPASSHNAELSDRLKTLTEERNRVSQGDRRLDSVWITASEIASEPYQTGALIKYTYIKAAAASNNAVESLRAYELLEKDYPGAAVMPDAVTTALKQLGFLQSQLEVAKVTGPIELKKLSNAISTSRADEAKTLKDALESEVANVRAKQKAAAADGSKFFPVFPKSKELLDSLQALIDGESKRLSQFKISDMRSGITSAKDGFRLIKEEKLKEAREQLDLSLKLWPLNHDNTKLKLQADQLSAALTAKSASAAKQAAAEEAAAKERKLAAEKFAKEAAEKAAREAAEKAAREAAQKAALEAAKEAAGMATPTPSPSKKDVTDKLKDRSQILDVLGQ